MGKVDVNYQKKDYRRKLRVNRIKKRQLNDAFFIIKILLNK